MKETKLIGVIGLILVVITHVCLAILYTSGVNDQYPILTTSAGIVGVVGWLMIGYYYYQKKK